MAKPTILASLRIDLDKSSLYKQIVSTASSGLSAAKSSLGGVEKMGADMSHVINVLGENLTDALSKKMSNMPSMLGKGFMKSVSTGIGFLSKITKFVGIAAIVGEVIGPAFKMLSSVTKMLGELVRPVVEVLEILLKPLLIMLRPIVMMFRTLMAPYRELAYRGLAASQVLISQGMQLGMDTEEGKGLVGEGLAGAISSASLLLSGFTQVFFDPLVTWVDSLGGIFEGSKAKWDTAMQNWEATSVKGIVRVSTLNGTFTRLIPVMGDTGKAADFALSRIEQQMSDLEKISGDWSLLNAKTQLENSEKLVDGVVGTVSSTLTTDEDSLTKNVYAVGIAAGITNQSIEDFTGKYLESAEEISNAAKNLQTVIDFNLDESLLSGFQTKAGELASEAAKSQEEILNPSLWESLKVGVRGIFNPDNWGLDNLGASMLTGGIGGIGLAIGKEVKKESEERATNALAVEEQFNEDLLSLYKTYQPKISAESATGLAETLAYFTEYLGNSYIPDEALKGLNHILIDFKGYIGNDDAYIPDEALKGLNNMFLYFEGYLGNGDDALIPAQVNTGLMSMQKGAESFSEGMKKVGDIIKSIASDAASYAASARASANSAASSARASRAAYSSRSSM